MTRAAQEFVRSLTFAALSGEKVHYRPVRVEFRKTRRPTSSRRSSTLRLAQAIDALVVVPATADVLAKFAQGIANDFLSTLYLATTAPVLSLPR